MEFMCNGYNAEGGYVEGRIFKAHVLHQGRSSVGYHISVVLYGNGWFEDEVNNTTDKYVLAYNEQDVEALRDEVALLCGHDPYEGDEAQAERRKVFVG